MKLICHNMKCKYYKEPLSLITEIKRVFADNRCIKYCQGYNVSKCKYNKPHLTGESVPASEV